jgi:peptidoglycan hydrolase-like protein with peptidoglycan-binding domain
MRTTLMILALLSLLLAACGGAALSAEAQGTAMAMAVQLTVLAQDAQESAEATATEAETATPTATGEPTATDEPLPTDEPTATDTPEPTATATPFVVPDWPLVRLNDEGPLVFALQHLLRSHGYNLAVDGKFGPQTRATVITFQNDKGLAADGIVGPQTWMRLIQGKMVKQNDTGQAVRAVQYLLRHLHGYNNVNVDGDFGPITNSRVEDFQDTYDLSVDGIVGPETWKALIAIEP